MRHFFAGLSTRLHSIPRILCLFLAVVLIGAAFAYCNFYKIIEAVYENQPTKIQLIPHAEVAWRIFFYYICDALRDCGGVFLTAMGIGFVFIVTSYRSKTWRGSTKSLVGYSIGVALYAWGSYSYITQLNNLTRKITENLCALNGLRFHLPYSVCYVSPSAEVSRKYYETFYAPIKDKLVLTTDLGINFDMVVILFGIIVAAFFLVFICAKRLGTSTISFTLIVSMVFAIAPLLVSLIVENEKSNIESRQKEIAMAEVCNWAAKHYKISPQLTEVECYDLVQPRFNGMNIIEFQKMVNDYRGNWKGIKEFGFVKNELTSSGDIDPERSKRLVWVDNRFMIIEVTPSGEPVIDSKGKYIEFPTY